MFLRQYRVIRVKDVSFLLGVSYEIANDVVRKMLSFGYVCKLKFTRREKNYCQSVNSVIYGLSLKGFYFSLIVGRQMFFDTEEELLALRGLQGEVRYRNKVAKILSLKANAFLENETNWFYLSTKLPLFYEWQEEWLSEKSLNVLRAENSSFVFNSGELSVGARKELREVKIPRRVCPNDIVSFSDKYFIVDIRPYIVVELRRLYRVLNKSKYAFEELSLNKSPCSSNKRTTYQDTNNAVDKVSDKNQKNTNTKKSIQKSIANPECDDSETENKLNTLHKNAEKNTKPKCEVCEAEMQSEKKQNVKRVLYAPFVAKIPLHEFQKMRDTKYVCSYPKIPDKVKFTDKDNAKSEVVLSNMIERGDYKALTKITPFTYHEEEIIYRVPVEFKKVSNYECDRLKTKYKTKQFQLRSNGNETEDTYISRVYNAALILWKKEIEQKINSLFKKGESCDITISDLPFIKYYLQEEYKNYVADKPYEEDCEAVASVSSTEPVVNKSRAWYFSQIEINRIERLLRLNNMSGKFVKEDLAYFANGYFYCYGNLWTVYNFGKEVPHTRNEADDSRNYSVIHNFFPNVTTLKFKKTGSLILFDSGKYLFNIVEEFVFHRFDTTVLNSRRIVKSTGCSEDKALLLPSDKLGVKLFNLFLNMQDNSTILLVSKFIGNESDVPDFSYVGTDGNYILNILGCDVFTYDRLRRILRNSKIYKRDITIYCWEFQEDLVQQMIEKYNKTKRRYKTVVFSDIEIFNNKKGKTSFKLKIKDKHK